MYEEELVKAWQKNKIFEKSVEQRDEKNSYVFYDGPPFATGLPHYGHIVASVIKDVVPRYWAMKGKRVERKWGWDCHGLPIENIVEKELKINSRQEIEKMGVDKFNKCCASKVLLYAEEWKKSIARIGRWVDMDADYKTMDLEYMESVWWVFKSLWEKDLVYEGYKIMHVCPRCETTLSNLEVSQGYKDVSDLAVIWKFRVRSLGYAWDDNRAARDDMPTYLLAWTTTPWSTLSTMGLSVGKDFTYVKVQIGKEFLIFAKNQLEKIMEGHEDYKIVQEIKGSELVGLEYEPIVSSYKKNPEVKENKNAYHVFHGDYVEVEEGTGIVTINGSYGEIDMQAAKQNDLPIIMDVAMNGKTNDLAGDYAGMYVKDAQEKLVKDARKNNLVWKTEKYEHSYPHCWRCETPLLNYATSSWLVSVEKIKKQLLKNAKDIYWFPTHIKDGRFGKWLEGAKDWSISRTRFWGNPMPVWRCECGEIIVVGSRQQLEDLSSEKVDDLHKQFVDKIKLPCPKCGKKTERVPEVLDCWFESGSMPYAQLHYPFENKEKFEENFPAEFIAEGVDQTRAWFYVLHVLSTALFNKPAYKNVIVNGIVLAEDGKKMSKRLQNYPDPNEVIDKYGADALRFYLMSSPVVKADDLCFAEKGVEETYRKVVLTSLNVLSFYKMYEQQNIDVRQRPENKNVLDKWVITKTDLLVQAVTEKMDEYNLVESSKLIADFINEVSTWYLRRSRDRFKTGGDADQKNARQTLGWVLYNLSLVSAPFTPFLSEHIYLAIEGKKESVHLEDWPSFDGHLIEKKILSKMQFARKVVELALAIRDEQKIKVRQPLGVLEYKIPSKTVLGKEIEQIIADEVNIKAVVQVEPKKAKRVGVRMKEEQGVAVAVLTKITPELKKEGLLRELIRQVNFTRKKQGLTINDQIVLTYKTISKDLLNVLEDKKLVADLKASVLAKEVKAGKGDVVLKVNGEKLEVALKN